MKKIFVLCLFLFLVLAATSCVTPMKSTETVALPPIELTYGALPDEICRIGKFGVKQCEDVGKAQGWVFCGKDKIRIYVRGYEDMDKNVYFDGMAGVLWHEFKHCIKKHGNPDTHWASLNFGQIDWGDE